ncbi:peptidase, S54 family [Leptospira inadai serovar Lyme str. 10]|uniref:Peptidase, S54 family n=2 Tax=Leptospira inadai serovar Lyme TaxID=293084 RepID=V6HWG7_9LEPT|nr:rhomboid family intramembrane serine protease [Leptospira inadai]EQA37289.1 peptidase, S54 family [Leptospira inadai serovar Lyme str. 10]PNV73041.1 rhomboid family intramembrane serine protease [Leptospira inadai serovar Lyme]
MAKRNYGSSLKLFGFSVFHPLNILLFTNFAVWGLLMLEGGGGILTYYFGLNPSLVVEKGMVWQIFTYGFLHVVGEGLFMPFLHIGMNMFGLYTLGFWICRYMNEWKFFAIYLLSQLGGGIFVVVFAFVGLKTGLVPEYSSWDSYHTSTIGASGGVFGILAIFGILFPEARFAFPPVRAKYAPWVLIGVGFAYDLFTLLQYYRSEDHQTSFFGMMSNSGHLGGAVFGLLALKFFSQWGKPVKSPVFLKRIRKEASPNASIPMEDFFQVQIRKNTNLLSKLHSISSVEEREKVLEPMQAMNANLCPPSSYDSEDPFCLRCEWLQNCELRRLRKKGPLV